MKLLEICNSKGVRKQKKRTNSWFSTLNKCQSKNESQTKLFSKGKKSLTALYLPMLVFEGLVIAYFSQIKGGKKNTFVFPEYNANLWKHGVAYSLESVEDAQSMRITWIIPPITPLHTERRPAQLIHKLICDG